MPGKAGLRIKCWRKEIKRSDLCVKADMPDMPVSSGFDDSFRFPSLNQFD